MKTRRLETGFTARLRQAWDTLLGTPPSFNKSYALLVGIGNYRYLPPLSSPARDVRKMADYLLAQGFDEVAIPSERNITIDQLRTPQKYFTNKIQRDDRFLFYYSGHGVSLDEGDAERGYIPLPDEVVGGRGRSIPMNSLVSWMKGLSTEHLLVILDSCFSGLAIEGLEVKAGDIRLADPKVDREALNRLSKGPAQFLLMAGTRGQMSYGGAKWNGSMFTDTLIKGLRQGVDPYHNRIITARALYVWLREMVDRETRQVGRDLTPMFKDLGPKGASEGDFIFVQ